MTSSVDRRRLHDGASALAVSSAPPETAAEARAQLMIVGDGIAALQSLDDLGREANETAYHQQGILWKRRAALEQHLKELEAKEIP